MFLGLATLMIPCAKRALPITCPNLQPSAAIALPPPATIAAQDWTPCTGTQYNYATIILLLLGLHKFIFMLRVSHPYDTL